MRCIGITILCLTAATASATDQLQIVQDRNLELKAGLMQYEAGAKVSGTNVSLGFITSSAALADYSGSDAWTGSTVDKLQILLPDGGTVEWPPGFPFAGVISKTLRIASTHFADGSTIQFTVKANWTLTRPGESKVVSLSKDVTLTAYNKAITLATVEEWLAGPPGHYSKPGDADYPNPANVPDMCYAAMTVGRPILSSANSGSVEGMNHSLWPTALADTKTWREATGTWRLDQKLKEATLLFAFTHGEQGLFRASSDDELVFQTGVYSEVHGFVCTTRTVPDVNIAIMYACAIYYGDNTRFARAIHVNEPDDTARADRAVVGTAAALDYRLYHSDSQTRLNLDYHAELLLGELKAGWPLQLALNHVQDSAPAGKGVVPMSHSNGAATNLYTIFNDPWARLVCVYLTQAEWNSLSSGERFKWYYKLP